MNTPLAINGNSVISVADDDEGTKKKKVIIKCKKLVVAITNIECLDFELIF